MKRKPLNVGEEAREVEKTIAPALDFSKNDTQALPKPERKDTDESRVRQYRPNHAVPIPHKIKV